MTTQETEKAHSATTARLNFIEPMQSKATTFLPTGEWLYEIKFDGYRALALVAGNKTQVLSRNANNLGIKFPGITNSFPALNVQDAILDGEIVALDESGRSSFQLLQAFEMGEKRPPVVFYAFDLLQLNGEDLKNEPIEKRKAKLEALLQKAPNEIRFSPSFDYDVKELLAKAHELGLEGLIAKRRGSRYEPGKRTGAWIKIKLEREQDFVIGGYTEPDGSRKYFGAILVGVYDGDKLNFSGRVGSGFSDKLLASLLSKFEKIPSKTCPFANLPAAKGGRWGQGLSQAEMKRCHWVTPTLVCQIKFAEWTRDGRLRQPVFLRLREDKNPKEITREAN